MYVHRLEFSYDSKELPDELSDVANAYLASLRMNGHICGTEWFFYLENNACATIALTPEHDSLSEQFNNCYVKKRLAEAKKKGISIVSHLLSEEIDSANSCHCSDSSGYILFTTFLSIASPVSCLDCFDAVPLYKLPVMPSGEYWEIISWQSNYQACDRLQMNCTVLEKSATQQLSNIQSSLSKQGREHCNTLSTLTNKPFYYYLYRSHGRSLTTEKKRLCPSCGESWYIENALNSIFHFKCERCLLLSNLAWNVSS